MAAKIITTGNIEQGLSMIDDVINTYKNSPAAYRAMIIKASYFINQKKYDEAESVLKTYIDTAKPEIVKPIGYPLLISIYDDNGNLEQAIETSKELIKQHTRNYAKRQQTFLRGMENINFVDVEDFIVSYKII